MSPEKHKNLLSEFIKAGGSSRFAKSVELYSLSNFAKLKYEFSKLNKGTTPALEIKTEKPKPKKSGFKDLISDYPVVLHPVYRRRMQIWLEVCSLKIELSNFKGDSNDAFLLQYKIYNLFIELDHCQEILTHYKVHKRVIDLKKTDLSSLSELEVSKRRDNLRSSITRRKQTISSLEAKLPPEQDETYNRKLNSINLKKEQLQQKINELLSCEKLLEEWKIKNYRH